MDFKDNCSCFNCKYYTDSIGEKGYCKFYRHNTGSPEVACPKFEQKPDKASGPAKLDYNSILINDKSKFSLDKVLMIAAILSCAIFSVIIVMFGILLSSTVLSFETVDMSMRVIFVVAVCVLIISLIFLSYMLISRFVVMRFVYMIAVLILVILMLVFYDSAWFNYHEFIMNILKTVFNIDF